MSLGLSYESGSHSPSQSNNKITECSGTAGAVTDAEERRSGERLLADRRCSMVGVGV